MFVNPLYRLIAVLIALVAVVGAIYAKGRTDAAHRAEIAQLESDLSVAKARIKSEQDARAVDTINASAAQAYLAALEAKAKDLNDYVATLEDAHSVCLSGADTDRLRILWD